MCIKKIVDFESEGEKPIKIIKKFLTVLEFDPENINLYYFEVVPNIVEVDK